MPSPSASAARVGRPPRRCSITSRGARGFRARPTTTSSRPTAGLCTRSKAEPDEPKAVLLGSGYAPPGGVCSGGSALLAGSAQKQQEDTLIPGTFYEVSGPLRDQGGRLRVGAGER